MELQFQKQKKGQVFKFEQPTETFLTSTPKIMDPYDKKHVYIGKSEIENGGEGMFAMH